MIKFSGKLLIKILVTLIFLSSMLYANFFAVRMIMRYGVHIYFYDKLLVANEIGGLTGLKTELEKIQLNEKSPRELKMAKDFIAKLPALSDPEAFLSDKVKESKQVVNNIINFRSMAIVFMIIVFACQGLVKFLKKIKSKKIVE